MRGWTQDLVWALTTMRRSRVVTTAVVLSLALAIGVNTAVFSVANAFLLRPLPVRGVDRLVRLFENRNAPGEEPESRPVWDGTYALWLRHNTVFSSMGACDNWNVSLTGTGKPERLRATAINAGFFPTLGVAPLLGRNIRPEEDRPGQGRVAILAHALWTSRFGADPRILGRSMTLDGQPYTVIGVMRPGFRYPYEADVWIPLAANYSLAATPNFRLYVIARLVPGITVEQARDGLNQLVARLARDQPYAAAPKSAYTTPLIKDLIRNLDRLIFMLLGGAGFVLLIACANVSNLLLAQSVTRASESAVRLALGASRRRLIRQYLTYTVLLALLGGALGILLTFWSIKPLVALSPLESIRNFDTEPRIDLPTLVFTLVVSLLVGVIFGLLPALRASRFQLNDLLREGGRSRTLGTAARRVLSAFVVIEVALALVLMVGAGLMLRSFVSGQRADRGFRTPGILSFKVGVGAPRFPNRRAQYLFVHEVAERLAALPGVVAAGATTMQPLEPGQDYVAFNPEGQPPADPHGYRLAHTRTATPGYLDLMKIPLLEGRGLSEHDDTNSPPVILISKSLAQHYWPGQDALGKRVKRGTYASSTPWLTVVGVVGTVAETPESDPEQSTVDAIYFPYSQTSSGGFDEMTFVLAANGDPGRLIEPSRQVVAGVDKDEPIYDVATLEQRLKRLTTQEKFAALLYGILGGLGLLLSTLGIYGVLSFSVSQRLHEFGIRSALGARPGEISGMIVRHALVLALSGLAVGTAAALALTRLLAKQLNEVSPRDPATLLTALAVLAAVALVSSYLPARRAARFDPLQALRHD